jgi:uncharacterized protein DUF6493
VGDDVWQSVADAIARGDVAEVVDRIESLQEGERKRLSTRAKREAKAREDDRWPPGGGKDVELRRARAGAADAAVFGTGGSAAAARSWWLAWDAGGMRERLVRCRPREWRQDWAERVMTGDEVRHWDWPIVHGMVKEGLIDRPEAAGYVSGAVHGMARPLAATLRSEPEWLSNDLWRLFEVEEAGLSTGDSWQPQGEKSWTATLCELAADGTISRDRLLDESLAALRRDFSPHNARWYHKLHEALEPTPEERLARLDDLLALLASAHPAVVGFALRALEKLERARLLPPDQLLEAIPPALALPVKGHASRGVKLVGRVLKRDASVVPIAVPVLVQALAHESRDVQELVLDIVERHGDALGASDREQLADVARDADPAVRSRIEALAGEAAPEPAVRAGPAVEVPGLRELDPDRPRLTGAPLDPPCDVEELLDRLAVALERGDDPDEIELMLDGVSRLRSARVDQGRARALVERALHLGGVWEGRVGFGHARNALSTVILRWLGGPEYRKIQLGPTGNSPREAIALRVRELVDDLPGGNPRRLLSTPTHPGGWIDPVEAVGRVAELYGNRPPVMDLAQLVLRLAPDGRDAARDAAGDLEGKAGAVLHYALGGERQRGLRGKLRPAWDAAEQARDPRRFELPERALDDTEAKAAGLFRQKIPKVDPASPADLVLEESWWGWEPGGLERWLTTVWPANHEGVFDLVARRLWSNLGTKEYGIGDVLEVLLDPAEEIRERGALLIALALGGTELTDRALAADVAIAALTTRRLDGATLGANLATLLREQKQAVPSRWAASLEDVAAAGPLAAHDVQVAIEEILAAAEGDDRRRLLGLVDLLRRLAVEADAAVTNPRAREWLASLSGSSKVGRAGSEALSVNGDGAERSRAAAAQAAGPGMEQRGTEGR